ncbi:TPA: C40 family peptidase [Kluyvera ascorbata]|uniref:NlpC/P60 domain-containing protein n=1 Tax=Kluyvera genomosp. 2 TaxID=2774054 RepID=A0A2T2Y861_9ENTR|nr:MULTISPECIES: NlpC/P60 family protein [Enterobacteriaceae]HAT3916563.1 C40 family peptidase [Kluyvera ascorbata]PSR48719.1 hypothetical protein C8256_01645 [Kluyvera genomosp. 2]BBQ83009.1 hypothetical protein WP3W18E02_15380 [Klebsiella sp. WP3-W18-ESBL-02]BBR20043.1 hypothetical protein WP3S18E05_15230 [Klebsiella sp. WP3-S18-ESBL-05]HAT3941476.1 C40 family peptidase [Kluyvera ascorbata]
MINEFSHLEKRFQKIIINTVDVPYKYGGRGMTGIDCSSLLLRAIRICLKKSVRELPWMTADQLAHGFKDITVPLDHSSFLDLCVLVFFDWDEDGIYEHAAVRILDGTWIWSSTSAGKVIHVNPSSTVIWDKQWREINDALDGCHSISRKINWIGLI